MKSLSEFKNENLGNFKEVAEKLTNMSTNSEVLKKCIISIVKTEGKCCNDSVRTESLKIREEINNILEKLTIIGNQPSEPSPDDSVQLKKSRWGQTETLPDFSKPPPTVSAVSHYTPISSSLSVFSNRKQDKTDRRELSRSRVRAGKSRERSRSKTMTRERSRSTRERSSNRTQHRDSSSDRSRSNDLGARNRSRAKSTARSPSRSRLQGGDREMRRSQSRGRYEGGKTIDKEDDRRGSWDRRGDERQDYSRGFCVRGNSRKAQGEPGIGGRGGGAGTSLF